MVPTRCLVLSRVDRRIVGVAGIAQVERPMHTCAFLSLQRPAADLKPGSKAEFVRAPLVFCASPGYAECANFYVAQCFSI